MDSFLSVSIEMVLPLSGFAASNMTFPHFLHSSPLGMEPWIVLVYSVDFGAGVDKFVGDSSGKFEGFHPFSVAQGLGELAEGFDHQD
jgi:hypothetical protein